VSFVVLLEIHLTLPDNGSLKGKRKEIVSLKKQLQNRFGASVAETDHHDLWQRSTLSAVLVGRDSRPLLDAADKVERFVESRFPDGVSFSRGLVSGDEVLG
jgi:uncharacterized protein YlxP (DUF503 family)